MNKIAEWIKQNKVLSVVLMAILVYWLFLSPSQLAQVSYRGAYTDSVASPMMGLSATGISNKAGMGSSAMYMESAPRMDVSDRMVITNTTLSLAVKDVDDSLRKIKEWVTSLDGYMVSSSQSAPEGPASGQITIRVPSDKLDQTLEYLKDNSVKVVSENIYGNDITDQYMDIESRMKTLESTKAKYEAILDSAVTVDEILRVTNSVLSIQDQIDSLKGQAEYLKNASDSSLITIYLSTDEYSLPYAPEKPWRPEVVFKEAVRAMITDLRSAGSTAIYIGVYAVFWLPLIIVALLIKKKLRKNP